MMFSLLLTTFVPKSLRCADDVAYINVETQERNRSCLELTEAGLKVVGYAFDQVDDHLQTPCTKGLLLVGYTQPRLPGSIWKGTPSKTGTFEKGWTVMTVLFPFRGAGAGTEC
uniref:GSKIP domain-containing protein n=1 Tax=Callithrix jacchus TaxID=9483 RepID=A0A8I3W1V8_CALJA